MSVLGVAALPARASGETIYDGRFDIATFACEPSALDLVDWSQALRLHAQRFTTTSSFNVATMTGLAFNYAGSGGFQDDVVFELWSHDGESPGEPLEQIPGWSGRIEAADLTDLPLWLFNNDLVEKNASIAGPTQPAGTYWLVVRKGTDNGFDYGICRTPGTSLPPDAYGEGFAGSSFDGGLSWDGITGRDLRMLLQVATAAPPNLTLTAPSTFTKEIAGDIIGRATNPTLANGGQDYAAVRYDLRLDMPEPCTPGQDPRTVFSAIRVDGLPSPLIDNFTCQSGAFVSFSPSLLGFFMPAGFDVTTIYSVVFAEQAPTGKYTLTVKLVELTPSGEVIQLLAEAVEGFAVVSPVLDYFALGDSIASGHGLMDDGLGCRRSDHAYPKKLESSLRTRYEVVNFPPEHFLACSGATTRDLRRQVDAVLVAARTQPTLVTITIGANDFGWSNIRRARRLLIDLSDKRFEEFLTFTLADVKIRLKAQIRRLLLAQPTIMIVLTEYHNPFNRHSILFGSFPTFGRGCPSMAKCYSRTEDAIHRLNLVFAEVRAEASTPDRIRVAGVHQIFHGHESPRPLETECGNEPPDVAVTWIQYRSDPNSNSFPPVPRAAGEWRGDCFHPNDVGSSVFAATVNAEASALRR